MRLVNDRVRLEHQDCAATEADVLSPLQNTHDGVKKRILTLVKSWVKDHAKNPDFDL